MIIHKGNTFSCVKMLLTDWGNVKKKKKITGWPSVTTQEIERGF